MSGWGRPKVGVEEAEFPVQGLEGGLSRLLEGESIWPTEPPSTGGIDTIGDFDAADDAAQLEDVPVRVRAKRCRGSHHRKGQTGFRTNSKSAIQLPGSPDHAVNEAKVQANAQEQAEEESKRKSMRQ